MSELIKLQKALLGEAGEFVKADGYLIYSTCSLDAAENEEVVDAFIGESGSSFTKEAAISSFPWETGHDGAAAFLLKRLK